VRVQRAEVPYRWDMDAPPDRGDRNDRGLLGRLTGGLTERVVTTVDPDMVLAHVDVDAVLQRVDVDAALARVDVNALLDRVDVNALLDRVDVDRLMSRVDVDALLARVDLEAAVRRSGVPDIVQESTGRMAGSALDLARRQLVGVDAILDRVVDRLLRRDPAGRPQTPPLLAITEAGSGRKGRMSITGHYALPITRAVAPALDAMMVVLVFTLATAGLDYLLEVFLGRSPSPDQSGILAVGSLVLWAWVYVFVSLAIAGQTIGKAVVGVRVVDRDGSALGVRQAFVRTLFMPISLAMLGLGLLLVLVHPRHCALHDVVARTAVVYDWGERAAELPGPLSAFLARQSGG
jgi:uncharacterized RDD family membrane protein YckC